MKNSVFSREQVDKLIKELNITDIGNATIGEVLLLATKLEEQTGIPFIRMDLGIPGLTPSRIAVEAEKEALDRGIASTYPPAEGAPVLRQEASRFIKAFLDVDVSPASCVSVTGSVEGSFASFIACTQYDPAKDTVLYIDPGFPVQKAQMNVLGTKWKNFDIHDYRGEKLRDKLEEYMKEGNIAAILYSNPNNPAWISFNEQELRYIGELANKYDTIILEDLAYLGMDFRKDYGKPFEAPFFPSVAHYTDNYILLISASKIFSYAGQRAAFIAISDKLYNRRSQALADRYNDSGIFGSTLTASILYCINAGTTHSTQYGFAAVLKAASDGVYNFVTETSEYARRTHRMKEIFLKHGFRIVYDKDMDEDVSDGFFFTVAYKDMKGNELMPALLHYGISSIALATTGSLQQGVRACCSLMRDDLYDVLDKRLEAFNKDHK